MSQSTSLKPQTSSHHNSFKLEIIVNCLSGTLGVGIGILVAGYLGWI